MSFLENFQCKQLRSWFVLWPHKPNEIPDKWNIGPCAPAQYEMKLIAIQKKKKKNSPNCKTDVRWGHAMQTDPHLSILIVPDIGPKSLETLPTCTWFTCSVCQYLSTNCITKQENWSTNHAVGTALINSSETNPDRCKRGWGKELKSELRCLCLVSLKKSKCHPTQQFSKNTVEQLWHPLFCGSCLMKNIGVSVKVALYRPSLAYTTQIKYQKWLM